MSTQYSRIGNNRFDTYSYIKSEFLNADRETFIKISSLYRDLYGNGAYNYLLSTYHSWKSGRVATSGQTLSRIIECVPKFLSDEKRFLILKNEVLFFIDKLHTKQKKATIKLSEVNNIFLQYSESISSFNQTNLPYMVGKRIFTEDEIDEFVLVCKYALFEKLRLIYRQLYTDLILIKEKLTAFNTEIFTASYQCGFPNMEVDLSAILYSQLSQINLSQDELKINGRYKQSAQKYILDELLQLNLAEQSEFVNHSIKSQDLDILISHYKNVGQAKSNASFKTQLSGEVGVLTLAIEISSINKLLLSILYSLSKISFCLAVLGFGLYKMTQFELPKVLIVTTICGLLFYGLVKENLKSIAPNFSRILRKTKQHGQ